jgi:type IX secretion system PorP/SprF family membrane protein
MIKIGYQRFLKMTCIVALLFALQVQLCFAQQKTQYTQYMFNGVMINPAYAGADEALSLTFIQRRQWAHIDNAPSTQTLSAHTLFKKKHFGLGVILVNDRVGVHKNIGASTNYAYHIRTGKTSYLSFGIQASVFNLKSDYASLLNAPSNDPKLNTPVLSQTFLDFGAGIYYRSARLHAGISVPELIPQKFSIDDSVSVQLAKSNFFGFVKYRINVNESIDLEPSGLLKYMSGVPLSYDLNVNMIYREVLTVGLSYRKSESIDFLFKAQVTPQLQLGYSYDHAVGVISRLANGSHELMVNYVFRYVRKNIPSPR